MRARIEKAIRRIELFSYIPLGMAAFFGSVLLVPYYRQRRLLTWGKPARAHIISTEVYKVRSIAYLKVGYQFDGGHGMCSGQSSIPEADLPWVKEEPVIFYDPANPAHNRLYPFGSVELRG